PLKKTKPSSSAPFSSTIRAEGAPSLSAVASVMVSGTSTPASSASRNHAANSAIGSSVIAVALFPPPSRVDQPANLLDAGLPAADALLVVALVATAEAAVADHLPQLARSGDQVRGLVHHRFGLRGHVHAGQARPGEVLAPVRVRVLRINGERDVSHLRPYPPGVEDGLCIGVICRPLTDERLRRGVA